MKYKVSYTGFACIEADSEDEARIIYDTDMLYSEEYVTDVEPVDEFIVNFCDAAIGSYVISIDNVGGLWFERDT